MEDKEKTSQIKAQEKPESKTKPKPGTKVEAKATKVETAAIKFESNAERKAAKAVPNVEAKAKGKSKAQSKRKSKVWKATFKAQRMIKRNQKIVLTANGNDVTLSGFRLIDVE